MYTKVMIVLLASLFVTTTAVLAESGDNSDSGKIGKPEEVKKNKKRTPDEMSQDMFGKGGLFGACQAEMKANCKDAMTLELKKKKGVDRVLEKLDTKNDVYSCLKSHEADLGEKCKNNLNNSPQAHRIGLRSACMGVIQTTCKDTLSMKKGEAPQAVTGANGSKAGKYIQCLMSNKDGITDEACSAALASYTTWFNTPKGQKGGKAEPSGQSNTGGKAE